MFKCEADSARVSPIAPVNLNSSAWHSKPSLNCTLLISHCCPLQAPAPCRNSGSLSFCLALPWPHSHFQDLALHCICSFFLLCTMQTLLFWKKADRAHCPTQSLPEFTPARGGGAPLWCEIFPGLANSWCSTWEEALSHRQPGSSLRTESPAHVFISQCLSVSTAVIKRPPTCTEHSQLLTLRTDAVWEPENLSALTLVLSCHASFPTFLPKPAQIVPSYF